MSCIAYIPIRYESSRFPGKTFAKLAGKRLIDWTLEIVMKSNLDDCCIVTSSDEIKRYVEPGGWRVINRPVGLECTDTSILHTIAWLHDYHKHHHDWEMLLQITNPTRTVEDINQALQMMTMPYNSIASVVNVGEYHPDRMFTMTLGKSLEPLTKHNHWLTTQRLPSVYLRDGSIYAWDKKEVQRCNYNTLLPPATGGIEIPAFRSARIDTPRDLAIAEQYLTS